MTPKTRSLREFRNPIGWLVLLVALAAAAGCSTAESPGGSSSNMNHVLPSGNSVDGWLVVPSGGTHASSATLDYIGSGGSSGCTQCHGSDLSGGISNVSCFGNPAGCHHDPVPNWVATPPAAQPHGVSAKKAPGSSGFASCQICHAANFSGGGAQVPCSRCHVVNAPHPRKPWRSSTGSTHTNTNTANAPVCAQCHYPGSPNNPANHPATPAPAGTAPGCFNSTLCHAEGGAPHPLGKPAWYDNSPLPQVHGSGPGGAKATPSSTAGFAYCQVCHGSGTNFAGGSSGVSCTNNPNASCHGTGVASPHPSQWRTGDSYVHTSTATGNAAVCAFCHTAGLNSPLPPPPAPAAGAQPDCFNNTLCHGAGGAPHPIPYNDNSHYLVTSTTFPGACSPCHDISAPSTKIGPACQTCHVAASPLAAPGTCTSCHASPPNDSAPAGSVYPNIAGAHAAHLVLNTPSNPNGTPVSCSTCHNGLTSRTLNHYNNAKTRVPPGDVAFLATYNAKTGASSFVPSLFTCANMSCHGGTAPNWRTGVIDVNANCTICHAQGTTQYNSYNSGEHGINAAHSTCLNCHNTSTLAVNHFTSLSTPAMEGPASATIGGGTTRIPAGNYVSATGSCTPTCHGTETW